MMFLVIFGSLAAAMAIVSQGNLSTADAQLKISRSLAAAETGMRLVRHRLPHVAAAVRTDQGDITPAIAEQLWFHGGADSRPLMEVLKDAFTFQLAPPPQWDAQAGVLHVGPVEMTADGSAPPFEIEFRPVFSGEVPVLRVRVIATDGTGNNAVTRSVSMDFQIAKRIPYAVLSKNQIMIGRNVMIEGPLGSAFMDTDLEHGHPIQMLSDFRGLNDDLDDDLDALLGTLIENDHDGDNRINLNDPAEYDGQSDLWQYDMTGDGYVDEFDLFLYHFDVNGDGKVTLEEMKSRANDPRRAEELFHLIDNAGYGPGDPPPGWFGDPDDFRGREGYGDGVIDKHDHYAKVRGSVYINAQMKDWNEGAAGGAYQDHFKGPIRPNHNDPALEFGAEQNDAYNFEPADFDVERFRNMTNDNFWEQVGPDPLDEVREEVPYGAAFPYEYYDRPVIEGVTFQNVRIPKGTNALFRNCTFIGVTFIETEVNNTDPNFNYAGMQESDGTPKFPGRVAIVNGQEVHDTRDYGNNIRFESCTFHGPVVTDAPQGYTHVRNKIEFNGPTEFDIEDSQHLTPSEKELFRRSTLLAPHYSVEMGAFTVPDTDDRIELSGTIVAGVFDMRGNIRIDGTLLTTFMPVRGESPVIGDTSPLFNTTLGYFGPERGDFEAELPELGAGMGMIHLRYNPTIPLPDGIRGPIRFEPLNHTYSEGGW